MVFPSRDISLTAMLGVREIRLQGFVPYAASSIALESASYRAA